MRLFREKTEEKWYFKKHGLVLEVFFDRPFDLWTFWDVPTRSYQVLQLPLTFQTWKTTKFFAFHDLQIGAALLTLEDAGEAFTFQSKSFTERFLVVLWEGGHPRKSLETLSESPKP